MPDQLPDSPKPDAQWLEQFVENQKQELALRAKELELEKQRDNNNLHWAKESLAAQERDRSHERDCGRDRQKDRHRFTLFLLLILAALIFGAFALDKDAIALELVKAIAYLMAGAAGGYGYAKSKETTPQDPPQNPSQ